MKALCVVHESIQVSCIYMVSNHSSHQAVVEVINISKCIYCTTMFYHGDVYVVQSLYLYLLVKY